MVIYRPLNLDPSLHPVIYLHGGPGSTSLGYISYWFREADNIFPGRTLILFDQRGAGLSSPKLECHDGDGPMVWYPVSENPNDFGDIPSRVQAAYAACAARHLAAGRKLSAFNTVQSAADVNALRRALKLKDVVLFGISYGTRLALTVMKLYPKNIHAAILDSVWPPQAEDWGDSKTFGLVLDRLFLACHQDEKCATAYPDLHGQLLNALKQLEKNPAIVEIPNLKTLYVRVDHLFFLKVLHYLMRRTDRIPLIPWFISSVAQGEYWSLKRYVEDLVGSPNTKAMGAFLSVICNDSVDMVNRQPKMNDVESYPYLRDFAASKREIVPCDIWPTKPGTGNHDAVSSEIPSLLLAGGLDASTTVEQAEMAAETLSQSHLFVFPANSHGQVRSNRCSWKVIDEFLTDPASRPNPKCLTSLPPPPFVNLGVN